MNVKLSYRKRSNGMPILSMKEIDGFAEAILTDFNAFLLNEPTPVDMESFIEFYLGLTMDYQDLSHNRSILGMTVFSDCRLPVFDKENGTVKIIPVQEKTVLIDNSLLEDGQEPRCRFTLGHEAAHWILHRHRYLVNKDQTTLFNIPASQPLVKCRQADGEQDNRRKVLATDYDWMEWQADYMSSALLMPKPTFQKTARFVLRRAGVKEGYLTKGVSNELDAIAEYLPRKMAEVFHVSLQAAKIRCDKLGLIKELSELAQALF